MYDFVLQLALMLSFAVIVYTLALGLPRVGEPEGRPSRIRVWIAKLPLHHVDQSINQFKGKVLRRLKVVVMKVDNFISSHMNRDKNSGL